MGERDSDGKSREVQRGGHGGMVLGCAVQHQCGAGLTCERDCGGGVGCPRVISALPHMQVAIQRDG